MESRRRKKQISAACHYAYTRLALNYYMYYEVILEGDLLSSRLERLSKGYHGLLKDFLEGSLNLEELSSLRDDTASAMEANTAYTDVFQAYEYVLNRLEGRFEPQLMGDRNVQSDEEEWTAEIMAYIMDTDEPMVVNERVQSVVSQLPIRLTRNKFFAMVEEGLSVYKGGPVSSLEDMLYILRSEAMLVRPEDMETGYEDLHSILREFENTDFKAVTAEEYRHLTAEMERAGQILMDTTGELMLFMDLINDLYVLMLSRKWAMMEVSEESLLKELLSEVQSLFEEGAVNAIPQELTDKLSMLEGKQETYFEQWMRLETEVKSAADSGDEDGEILGKIELLMSDSSFMSLERPGDRADQKVDEELMAGKLERFFGELSAAWEGKPKVLVRASMSKILSRLPVFFNSLEEVRLYVEGSLRSCSDSKEKEISMRLIRMMIEQDKFDLDDY
ncbi:MAG: hypothetical protein LUK37_08135 [Clostridia bacterium]|nr:hypothetical protein [Clostridia bacterium]